MQDDKLLYPLKFRPIRDEYSWGDEEFRLADLGYRDSLVRDGWLAGNSIGEVMDMYMDRVVGDDVFDCYGRQFPVCVRNLHIRGRMPLRVHPGDETAAQRYDFLGKEKLWHVLRAGRDARIMLGFRRDTDASELLDGCAGQNIDGLLNTIAPHAGQSLVIPAGTPHAAAGELDIIEIGESSPLDFLLCSWDAEPDRREFDEALGIIDALDFIDYRRYIQPQMQGRYIVDIPQFSIALIPLKDPLHVSSEEPGGFAVYTCVKGEAAVEAEISGQRTATVLGCGETLLVPSECHDFNLTPRSADAALLETCVNIKAQFLRELAMEI